MEPCIYLYFNGNCLEAMQHYAKVLGGEISGVFRNVDVPDPGHRMPGHENLVMNMAMRLNGVLFMASDAPDGHYNMPQGFSVSLQLDSSAEFDRIHKALSADRQAEMMAPEETFWAERFAMFTDKYGTPWMLNFTGNKAQGGNG